MKALIILLATGAVMSAQAPPPKSAPPASKSAAPVSNPLLHPETLKAKAPDDFKVKFTTTKGDFVVEVHRAWSPLGADRFYNLVRNHYFTNASFFRIVPGFIAQFGMAADPKIGAVWQNANIKDDPMRPDVHNTRGTLVFATSGPNTRTTQLFINLRDNTSGLDPQHFSPFGEVVSGMDDVVMKLYTGYGEGSDMGGKGPTQQRLAQEGKPYLDKNFPLLDSVKTATILPADGAPAPKSAAPAPPVKK